MLQPTEAVGETAENIVRELVPSRGMKNSGVDWLGRVPGHWNIVPGRSCFYEKKHSNSGLQETTVLSLSYGQIVVKPPERLHGLVPSSFETYQIVDPLDIVVRPTDLQNDRHSLRFGLSKYRGTITSAYICLLAARGMTPEYGHLLLHSYDLMKVFYGLGSGLRQNLDWGDFKYLPCCLPPVAEQAAIVRFLDYVDRRIRRYVAAKEKLIALLEEQKQAVIHQAVTGEIDVRTGQPYPAYKDSGVEWLGEVPEHWGLSKLRHCAAVSGGMTPSMADRRFWDGQIPWVTPKDLKSREISDSILRITNDALEETSIRLVEPPAVLLVVRGMILARKVPIARTTVPVTLNQDMKALVPNREISASFLAAFLECAQDALRSLVDESGHGTRRLPTKHWRGVVVALPPLKEQEAIVAVIQSQVRRVTASVESALRQNRLVSEYKSRLAADVVTGKLDVRGAVAPLAEVDPPAVEDGLSAPLEPQPENPCRSDTDEVTEPANP